MVILKNLAKCRSSSAHGSKCKYARKNSLVEFTSNIIKLSSNFAQFHLIELPNYVLLLKFSPELFFLTSNLSDVPALLLTAFSALQILVSITEIWLR